MLPRLVRRRKQPFPLRGESFTQFGGYLSHSAFICFLRPIMHTVGLYRSAPKRHDITHSETCFQRKPERKPGIQVKALAERLDGFFFDVFAFHFLLSQNVKFVTFCHLLSDARRSPSASGLPLRSYVFAPDEVLDIAPLSVSA